VAQADGGSDKSTECYPLPQNSSIERVFGVEPTVRLRGAVPSSARGVCL
jgi:hypothetical protein